jgi:hypothetical protein
MKVGLAFCKKQRVVFLTKSEGSPLQSIDSRIRKRVSRLGGEAVFVPSDFLDLGSRRAVDLALHRMVKDGTLRRLARGLYDYPNTHPELGVLLPSIDSIAKALAGKDRLRLQPTGAYAANLLGLSEQVPARIVFLTDGASRTVTVGPTQITLRRTTPRNMAASGRLSGLVIQAFRHIGQSHMTPERVAYLRKTIPAPERRKMLKDLTLAPSWMHPLFHALASD